MGKILPSKKTAASQWPQTEQRCHQVHDLGWAEHSLWNSIHWGSYEMETWCHEMAVPLATCIISYAGLHSCPLDSPRHGEDEYRYQGRQNLLRESAFRFTSPSVEVIQASERNQIKVSNHRSQSCLYLFWSFPKGFPPGDWDSHQGTFGIKVL